MVGYGPAHIQQPNPLTPHAGPPAPPPQTKGKAAIDVICNPLGKSGGALIQQFMIIGFGSLAASTPYLGLILLGIVGMWIYAAKVGGVGLLWLGGPRGRVLCTPAHLHVRRLGGLMPPSAPALVANPAPSSLLLHSWLQDLDWRFAAAQEEMQKADSSADEGDATPASEGAKPSTA